MSGSLIIQQPGHSVVTDLGRFRGPRFGLPVNGALDQFSARAANILAANDDNAPLVEITALDFRMRATTDILIAVTGAPLHLTVGGRECQQWEPVSVRAGETVTLRGINGGLRAYIAVHGSVQAPVLLGSCAPDTVVGFGLHRTEGFSQRPARPAAVLRSPAVPPGPDPAGIHQHRSSGGHGRPRQE
jgi:allophanate hydrolase subunit 2